MPLIAEVGRKSWSSRLLLGIIYFILCIMGACMVIPFLITISSSLSTASDYWNYNVIPRFLFHEDFRYVRGLSQYFFRFPSYGTQMKAYFPERPRHWNSWSVIGRDKEGHADFASFYLTEASRNPEGFKAMAKDYSEFSMQYDLTDLICNPDRVLSVDFLIKHYSEIYREKHPGEKIGKRQLMNGALHELSEEWETPFESFYNVQFDKERALPLDSQNYIPDEGDGRFEGYKLFLRDMQNLRPECGFATPFCLRVKWYEFLGSERLKLELGHTYEIEKYNAVANTDYPCLERTPFPLPASFPKELQAIWRRFQNEYFPLRLCKLKVTPEMEAAFQKDVQTNVPEIATLNKMLGTNYSSFAEVRLPAAAPRHVSKSNFQKIWLNFAKKQPPESKVFTSSEIAYQAFVMEKYGSLEKINQAYHTEYSNLEEIFPPFHAAYTQAFNEHQWKITLQPAVKNFYMVMSYLLFNGNAILVTLGLIALTLCFTLTINPLAAYALSRFNLKGHDKIILYMLATMAFPTMVSAIPSYLLMRDLGMLNTMWALVLPSAANGMSIFILKGFFDSLPQELFEAATIDGASEFQIFRIVAMPLVKPILAINCLTAFMHAYNGWEWALIICQKKSMWTIAVWLYQASIWWSSEPWIVSAGFIIASIPTLLVFLSCQKIILRGIVIPTMK